MPFRKVEKQSSKKCEGKIGNFAFARTGKTVK